MGCGRKKDNGFDMNIFSSSSSIVWSGKNFDLKKNGEIVLRKNAFLKNNIGSLSGRNKLRIVGKKRTGKGEFYVKIISMSGAVLFAEKISFTKKSYSEVSVNFDINGEYESCSLILERGAGSFGTVEVSKMAISFMMESQKNSTTGSTEQDCRYQRLRNKQSSTLRKRCVGTRVPLLTQSS